MIWFNNYFPRLRDHSWYLLCETKDGLFFVFSVGAEALDIHTTAKPLQHLGLGEVSQTFVVHMQLADQLLHLFRPVWVCRHMLRDQSYQLFWVSLSKKTKKKKRIGLHTNSCCTCRSMLAAKKQIHCNFLFFNLYCCAVVITVVLHMITF